jgi:flagellar biosynthetic protein FlhB
MADDMGEKSELPTPKKRQEARNRGQVAKSQDLSAAIDLLGATIILALLGVFAVRACKSVLRKGLGDDAYGLAVGDLGQMMRDALLTPAISVAPVLALMLVVAGLTQVVQVGLHVTGYPVTPKLDRLNPINGFKNLFGLQNLVKTGMGVAKMIVVGIVAWLYVASVMPRIATLPQLAASHGMLAMGRMVLELAIWLLAVLLALGLLDFMYQRWQMTRNLRMTKQEVEDEHRNMDGDPELKARRFRMMRDIIGQQIGRDVPTADVIVTNPTHYAVAIRYDEKTMAAPVVVAKGVDTLALRIRQVALLSKVPIVERPPLARALYASAKPGQAIKPEFYQAVAELLAYVYRLDATAKAERERSEQRAQEAAREAMRIARAGREELVRV